MQQGYANLGVLPLKNLKNRHALGLFVRWILYWAVSLDISWNLPGFFYPTAECVRFSSVLPVSHSMLETKIHLLLSEAPGEGGFRSLV